MSYHLPEYILKQEINSELIDYVWDDYLIEQQLDYSYAKNLIEQIDQMTLRAKITLAIGLYEWVLGRFYQMNGDTIFDSVAEAAWCANIDRNYISYFELDSDEYIGPVDYALWMSFSALYPILLVSKNISDPNNPSHKVDPLFFYEENEWADGITTLISLLLHILPSHKLDVFKNWLQQVINRLVHHYPAKKDNPFENLFGYEDDKDWLGDYVAREVLDLECHYKPEQSVVLLNQYLNQVNYQNNQLLVPIDELTRKIDNPYHID